MIDKKSLSALNDELGRLTAETFEVIDYTESDQWLRAAGGTTTSTSPSTTSCLSCN